MLKSINSFIQRLNNNKYLLGFFLIIINLGSKFIDIRLNDYHEKFIKETIGKELLVFAITFVGTRDIYTAIVVTSIFFIINDYLLNEKSSYCIVPDKYRLSMKQALDINEDDEISDKEIHNAMMVLDKAKRLKTAKMQREAYSTFMNNL